VPDDPTKQRPRDPNRINIHEHGDVGYWCKRFNCSRAQLVAVHTVGPLPDIVANFLREVLPPTKLQLLAVRNPPPKAAPPPPPGNG